MFLHKKGCEYYEAEFLDIIAATKILLNNSGNERDNLKADKILNEERNAKEIISELKKHMDNIMNHMKKKNKEKNVLEKFADKVEDTIGGNLTDANGLKMKFSKMVHQFEHLESRYERLEECLNKTLTHRNDASNVKAKELLDDYIAIKTALDNIHVESKKISDGFLEIIREMQKEKELILREEETVNDFHKNMMSWF